MLTQKSDGRKRNKNKKENLAGNSTAVRTPPACRSRTHLVEDYVIEYRGENSKDTKKRKIHESESSYIFT
ncbi:hypothetical protein AVEN_106522-1, partial [Araneus ventricosus]